MCKEIDQEVIRRAYSLYEDGDLYELYDLLKPLVSSGNPHILYCSRFSLDDREDLLTLSNLEILHYAAEKGVPDAMYNLAIHYMLGDEVAKNEAKAGKLFEKAALCGHSFSKLTHGLNLYHGLYCVPQDKNKGIDFVHESVEDKVEGALEELGKL